MIYSKKLQNLINRRGDEQYLHKSFSAGSLSRIFNETTLRTESYINIDFPESVKYTLGAMAEVDKEYTQNTLKEGDRIQGQLETLKNEGFNITFRFQGSTTNNTHIKQHSDIDLLVLQEDFMFGSSSGGNSYQGDWKSEQILLRQSCYEKLKNAYYTARVDNTGNFAISITGGSLKRKIDVVPACWDMTKCNTYFSDEALKGIKVFTKDCTDSNINYPFLNNKLIEEKDKKCNGNYRKAVRLLKTLKVDSDRDIEISSYDIVALLYHIDNSFYCVGNQYLSLIKNITNYLVRLTTDYNTFSRLDVPDGTRKISEKTTLDALKGITVEVGDLEKTLVQELAQKGKTMNENFDIGRRIYS
jgi:hypothetical protein